MRYGSYALINNCMYSVHFEYPDSTTSMLRDVNTFSFATELLLRGIYCEQPDESTLVFDSERDALYATLKYNGSASTTVSKDSSFS